MDVPLIVFVPPLSHVDVMLEPGAYRCTQLPKFEYEALASVLVDAATDVTFAALDGDELQALALLFPAATARKTPRLARLFAAEFIDVEKPPPSDMLATDLATWLLATQFIPAITPDVLPEPLQLSTRTARSDTPFATP